LRAASLLSCGVLQHSRRAALIGDEKSKTKWEGSEKALPCLKPVVCAGDESPPLPAQTTNLFDAACALPGLEKPGEVI
jgi:hypothetical protein